MGIRKVVDRPEGEARRFDGGQDQEAQPQGRGEVRHDAVEERHPVAEPQSLPAQHDPEMLHVALGPALVAREFVHQ